MQSEWGFHEQHKYDYVFPYFYKQVWIKENRSYRSARQSRAIEAFVEQSQHANLLDFYPFGITDSTYASQLGPT